MKTGDDVTVPRVLPADLEAEIATEHYFTAYDGVLGALSGQEDLADKAVARIPKPLRLLTFCVLVLKNGYTVTGTAAPASAKGFVAEVGRRVARQNALAQMWPLLGFQLRDAIAEAETKTRGKRVPRYRCAESGEYVTRGYAEANPANTVKES